MNHQTTNPIITPDDITGLVLAGGKSTRMGQQNKALLPFADTTLLDHCFSQTSNTLKSMLISCGRHSYPSQKKTIQIHDDGEQGPLIGVLSGLKWVSKHSKHQWLLSIPCDTPLLDQHWIAAMLKGLNGRSPLTPVYARHNGKDHFAHALWPISAIAVIEDALTQQQRSLYGVLKKLNATAVDLSVTCSDDSFSNINSLADAATVQQKIGCSAASKQPK